MGALHALSNPPDAFNRLCGLSPISSEKPIATNPLPQQGAPRLEAEVIRAICEAYEGGEPITTIAQRFGVHRSTLYIRLDRAGVALRRREALTAPQVERAGEMYARGQSLAKVGSVLGVDAQTVRNHLANAGVAIRKRPGWAGCAR